MIHAKPSQLTALIYLFAFPAIAIAPLLAYSLPPSSTFLSQAAALVGWSLWLMALAAGLPRSVRPAAGLSALLAALALLALAVLGSICVSLPSALGLSTLGMLAAAVLTAWIAAQIRADGDSEVVFHAFCLALLAVGVLSALVGLLQVFDPASTGVGLLAPAGAGGRAAGNLRQPNHLSSLLLWSVIGTVWLVESRRVNRVFGAALVLFFIFALVLTASRTGVVGVGLLALWGALDRRMSRFTRVMMVAAPIAYFLFWSGLAAWAHGSFGAEARLTDTADSPNSRRHIWADALSLISRHPWFGVGFGEFNFAWSLTPFPGRPTAFFDHTHNLPLQLAVELGVPLATLLMGLLVYALWRAWSGSFRGAPGPRSMTSAAAMMVLMIAVHSLVEYPLWYSYFLLPTAFLWGMCLGAPMNLQPDKAIQHRPKSPAGASWALLLAALLMAAGGGLSIADYLRVSGIFTADDDAPPLSDRIEAGKRSVLFAHHAHYAAATTAERPSEALPSFNVAAHYLLDTRLMMAWAIALHESGDEDRARYVAARLREFRNPDSKSFFAPCEAPDQPGVEKPFQCLPPTKSLSFEDFR